MSKFKFLLSITLIIVLSFSCEGPAGPAGRDGMDATVYYSEWFSPTEWSGTSGDWYFSASAPDLTEDIVEGGVILAYAWLNGDLYESTAVRPLPTYAIGANWSFLIHEYGSIEFTCDMISQPETSTHYFRFVAIPGTILALESSSVPHYSEKELRNMSYEEIDNYFTFLNVKVER